MLPKPSLLQHVIYRVFRLRRLIATSVLIVMAGAALSLGVSPQISVFADPANLLVLMICWSAIITGSAIAFPAGWIDALTASIAFALLLVATPYFQIALMAAPWTGGGISERLAVLLVFLAWFMLWLLVMAVFIWAGQSLPFGKRRHYTRLTSDLPPDEVRRALCPLPDTTVGGRVCGPEGADGFFKVSYTVADPGQHSFEIVKKVQSYRFRVLQEDRHTRQSEAILTVDGRKTRSEMFERLEPSGKGTVYHLVEMHDHFNLLTAIGFWINDFGADHARAYLDAATGRATTAIFSRPGWSPITAVARALSRAGQS